MTEQELLAHATEYIEKLANGINPLTNEPVSENDIVNNVRISRCLFYVADTLRNIKTPSKTKKRFAPTEDIASKYEYSDDYIYASGICERLAKACNADRHPSGSKIANWLTEQGYFTLQTLEGGQVKKIVTPKGKAIGIIQEWRDSVRGGMFLATLYNRQAQEFIVKNIEKIYHD